MRGYPNSFTARLVTATLDSESDDPPAHLVYVQRGGGGRGGAGGGGTGGTGQAAEDPATVVHTVIEQQRLGVDIHVQIGQRERAVLTARHQKTAAGDEHVGVVSIGLVEAAGDEEAARQATEDDEDLPSALLAAGIPPA